MQKWIGELQPYISVVIPQLLIINISYLLASLGVLFWAQEEGPIDQWVAIKHRHDIVAKHARNSGPLLGCQSR